jgi:hypothetical protein
VNQAELDAVAQQAAGRAVVSGPEVPESRVGEAGEARRELQAEQVEEREDDVAVAGGVGAVVRIGSWLRLSRIASRPCVASRTVARMTRVAKCVCWSETKA